MVIDFYNRNGGGGGGTADYATRAGESNKTKLLEGGSALPQSANTGDVVAVAPTPTRGGAKSGGESLGIYQYDGNDWNKIEGGEGGDNTILKAVSGAPATLENGDVFAIHTPSADTQYEVSAWTETGEYTISFDHPVQAIKVHIKTNGHFDFGFNDSDWHDGFGFDIEADGEYGYVFDAGDYDSSRWEVSEQDVKFIAPEWMAKTDGKTLYLAIRENNDDYYLYIYSEDVELIWITDVAQNETEGEVQEGTVIPAHDAYDQVFQANITTEPNVKIELEGDARVDGTLDNPTEIVTKYNGQMKISFYDNSNVQGVICDLESYGTYFHLYYDYSTDGWTLFDSDEENTLIKIQDGESGSADFGDGNAYLSYSDGVLTAYTDYEKGWKNWEMGDGGEVLTPVEIAKVTDLPAENRLVPRFNKDEDSNKVLFIDYWNPNGLVWQSQNDLVRNVFATYEGLGGSTGKALIQKDAYTFAWEHIDRIYPISLLPVQAQKGMSFTTEDGIFHAGDEEFDTTNLYEIENHNDWDNPTGGTQLIISGSNYNNRVGFKFEGYGDDFMLIWYGGDWGTEWLENVTQDNGNLTGYTTGTPIEIIVAYDGTNDVFEITCGEPWAGLYAGNDEDNHYSQYFVANLPVTKYSKSVTSNSINSIVKLTQAEYDALVSGGTVDENTFYLIVAEPQPQSLGVWSDDGNGTYTFQMLDTDPASWSIHKQIGQLLGVIWTDSGSSDPIDMNVYLHESDGSWEIVAIYTEGHSSDEPHYDFTDGTQDEWDTGIHTSETSSDSNILVSWDGTDTFTFYSGDSDYPLSMNTIDPTAE